MEKTIFLDRDGTINKEVNYLHKPENLEILEGVPETIKRWNDSGYRVIVVSNQAGVARGYYTEADVDKLHAHINHYLQQFGARIDHYFYCPHHPIYGIGSYKIDCNCRKPKPGMLQLAERFYEVDKRHSYMIGDKNIDVDAGHNFGITSILVGTGYGSEEKEQLFPAHYDFFAENLAIAADWIASREE